jgi:hypothetical protein
MEVFIGVVIGLALAVAGIVIFVVEGKDSEF